MVYLDVFLCCCSGQIHIVTDEHDESDEDYAIQTHELPKITVPPNTSRIDVSDGCYEERCLGNVLESFRNLGFGLGQSQDIRESLSDEDGQSSSIITVVDVSLALIDTFE